MTQVFAHKIGDVVIYVREEQKDALNEALDAKSLILCGSDAFDLQGDYETLVATQPHRKENKAYIPSDYKSEDFLSLLDEKDPMAYLTKDVIEVVEEEESKIVVKKDPITKLKDQIAKQAEKLKDSKIVADKENLQTAVNEITASFGSQIKTFQDFITPKFLEDAGLLEDLDCICVFLL